MRCSPSAGPVARMARRVAGPPKISVDNRLSDSHTVVEVKCPDRVGLLYAITRTLSALELDIGSARIATEIDHAYDTFYVTDREGRRVEDPRRDEPSSGGAGRGAARSALSSEGGSAPFRHGVPNGLRRLSRAPLSANRRRGGRYGRRRGDATVR